MKVTSYAVARPAYYDRNAIAAISSYGAVVAPAYYVTRWTRTIAAGKKAYIEVATSVINRATVASVAATQEGFFTLTSGASTIDLVSTQSLSNTVGVLTEKSLSIPVTLYAGETLDGKTNDQSTGGTVYLQVAAKFTIFDA